MTLEYIKSGGVKYSPQEPNEPICPEQEFSSCKPVCRIKKLLFGMWQIDYHQMFKNGSHHELGSENKPNTRLILYPSGIEEISYKLND